MKTAGACGNPDFPGHAVAVDNDLAPIREFDFQHTAGSQFAINICAAGLKRRIYPRQRKLSLCVKFLVFHRMLPSRSLLTASSPMSKIIAVVLSFSLAACGMKTALVMPAGPAPEPLLGNPSSAKSTTKQAPASAPDVSTDTKTNISNTQ